MLTLVVESGQVENTNSGGIGVKLVELDNINSDVNKLRKCWVSPGKMCGKSFLFT